MAHIPLEDPWESSHVVVAEIKEFEDTPYFGRRVTVSVLVPIGNVGLIRDTLSEKYVENI